VDLGSTHDTFVRKGHREKSPDARPRYEWYTGVMLQVNWLTLPTGADGYAPGGPTLQTATPATLVLFPGSLGDFICFLPTLRVLCGRCADRGIVVVVQAKLLPLAVRPELGDGGVALESAAVARLFVAGAAQQSLLPRVYVGDVYSWFGTGDPSCMTI